MTVLLARLEFSSSTLVQATVPMKVTDTKKGAKSTFPERKEIDQRKEQWQDGDGKGDREEIGEGF